MVQRAVRIYFDHTTQDQSPARDYGHGRCQDVASLVWVMVGSLALAAGCASLVDTPAQELARNRWTVCYARVTGTELNTVQRDGRISFWYSGAGESQTMLECLREAAKMGPDLPEPIAQRRPDGSGGGGGAM